ncbi:chemokine XC receptor 1-like [Cololabis saira]|uniref:chemokine XC receptor 1-like n=1 Tax=Cololabis saira TaxID=129043 RepID=UPI002AD4F2F0|nr:chemokine XC receptor 1-like [Cololabis saira]
MCVSILRLRALLFSFKSVTVATLDAIRRAPLHLIGPYLIVPQKSPNFACKAGLAINFFSSLISIHHKEEHSMGCECNTTLWQTVGIFQQNIFFLVAFAVMAFCYIQILQRITRARSHTKNRAVKLIFCIVAVFFVSWVPYNVVIFLRVLAHSTLVEWSKDCNISVQLDYAFYVCRLIAFSHCCLNPVFYAFVGVKFRSHFKSILHRLFRRQPPAEEQQVRLQNLISQGSMY